MKKKERDILTSVIKEVITEMTAQEKTAKKVELSARIKSLTIQLNQAKKDLAALSSQAITPNT